LLIVAHDGIGHNDDGENYQNTPSATLATEVDGVSFFDSASTPPQIMEIFKPDSALPPQSSNSTETYACCLNGGLNVTTSLATFCC